MRCCVGRRGGIGLRWLCLSAAVVLLGGRLSRGGPAPVAEVSENAAEVAYLYNFARFISWPPSSNTTFTIAVLDTEALGSAANLLAGRTVRGMPVRLVAMDDPAAAECRIAYLNGPNGADVRRALEQLDGRPVLTVGNGMEFMQWGGMVSLWTERKRLRFEIHAGRLRLAGLVASAQLLEVATAVRGGEP